MRMAVCGSSLNNSWPFGAKRGSGVLAGEGGVKPSFMEMVDSVPLSTDPSCPSILVLFYINVLECK